METGPLGSCCSEPCGDSLADGLGAQGLWGGGRERASTPLRVGGEGLEQAGLGWELTGQ